MTQSIPAVKLHIWASFVVLTIGVACFFVHSKAQTNPAQDTKHAKHKSDVHKPATRLTAAKLLHEFTTAEYPWKQSEVGAKLVILKDKSVIPAMLALLKSADRAKRCNAGRVLVGLGDDRGLFAVIAEFEDTGNRPNTDEEGLAEVWPKEKAPARQIIQDRYYAAHVLREIGDQRAVPALIRALEDRAIDYQAAIVLGRLGDSRAIPALLAALERAQSSRKSLNVNRDMRFYAAYGLMWLGHRKGLPTVARCLGPDRHQIQRRHAADALGEFGDKAAVPFLIEALKDNDVEVRVNAIMALGSIGDGAAIPALKVSFRDKSPAKGRARIRYELPAPLFEGMTVREAVAHALTKIETRK